MESSYVTNEVTASRSQQPNGRNLLEKVWLLGLDSNQPSG